MKPLFTPQWQDPEPVIVPDELRQAISGSELLLETLVRRGYADPQKARAFLDPDQYTPASPLELPNLAIAVERIQKAIADHEKIGIWGDFDVDGQTSTTVLVAGLRHLGADVLYHIPVRKSESHGILIEPLKTFLQQGIQLIVTCDTGISAFDAVQYASEQGVDVIITDHHSLPPKLPKALSVVNPQRLPSSHPLYTLSGVGAAYKLIEQLCLEANDREYPTTLLDLVAMGLVADVAALTGDTRYLVQKGLQLLNSDPRPSLKKMFNENDVFQGLITEETISFVIAPRLNAVGRLSDANPMVDFLLSSDPVFIATEYNQIEGFNAKRKILCDQVFRGAQAQLEANPKLLERPLLMLAHPEWESGVVGIVASRLVELYHRPVILLNTKDPAIARGSCRSVEGINITEALRQNSDLLLTFGGHPMAAGLAVRSDNLDALQFGLIASINHMISENHISLTLPIDAYIDLNTIDLDLIYDLSRLAPFGAGNPPLRFAAKNLNIQNTSFKGKTKEHLQINVHTQNGKNFEFVWWQGAGLPQPQGPFDLVFHASANIYKGKVRPQYEWEEFRENEDQLITTSNSRNKPNTACFDLRACIDPVAELTKFAKDPSSQIYSEGNIVCPFPPRNRFKVIQDETLIIWSIPPSPMILQELITRVKPSRVIWFGNLPPENDLKTLISTGVSQIKKYLTQTDTPALSLADLASSLATTIPIARLLLKWLAYSGEITLLNLNTESALFTSQKNMGDPQMAAETKTELIALQKETAAFRAFYLRSPSVESLIPPQK
jgi:single-stranded-DNA-specific exonuclease